MGLAFFRQMRERQAREAAAKKGKDATSGPEGGEPTGDTGEGENGAQAGSEGPQAPDNGDSTLPDGYRVEQKGVWFTLYGPDGAKVGVSKRTADEAAAQAP